MSDRMLPISRQRLRWWLRCERALGLSFVHTPGRALLPTDRQRLGEPAAQPLVVPVTPAHRGGFSSKGTANLAAPTTFASTEVAGRGGAAPVQAAAPETALTQEQGLLLPATRPFDAPELSPAQKADALRLLDESFVRGCQKCGLSRTRQNTVFGEGNPDARLMFVGEGPGFNEDQVGRPFYGRAGQKLNEMIQAMGYSREQVYICNIVKCRAFLAPTGKDRPPLPEEVAACMPYLQRQIEVVRPRVMVTLGLSASQSLLGIKEPMSRMRGKWRVWRGIPVMPTFHPSYILRNYTTETRRAVWEDLKQVKQRLEDGSS